MTWLAEVFSVLTQSDVAPGAASPFWYCWTAVQGAHAFFGLVLALVSRRWAALGFLILAGKEIVFDLPNAGFVGPVVLDSLADLAVEGGSYAWGRWRLRRLGLDKSKPAATEFQQLDPAVAPGKFKGKRHART